MLREPKQALRILKWTFTKIGQVTARVYIHNTAVDRKPNCISFLHKKGLATIVTMVRTHQGNELSTAFEKVSPNSAFVWMVF